MKKARNDAVFSAYIRGFDSPRLHHKQKDIPRHVFLLFIWGSNGCGGECRAGGTAEPQPGPLRRAGRAPRLHQIDITQTPAFSKVTLPSGCGCDVKTENGGQGTYVPWPSFFIYLGLSGS